MTNRNTRQFLSGAGIMVRFAHEELGGTMNDSEDCREHYTCRIFWRMRDGQTLGEALSAEVFAEKEGRKKAAPSEKEGVKERTKEGAKEGAKESTQAVWEEIGEPEIIRPAKESKAQGTQAKGQAQGRKAKEPQEEKGFRALFRTFGEIARLEIEAQEAESRERDEEEEED